MYQSDWIKQLVYPLYLLGATKIEDKIFEGVKGLYETLDKVYIRTVNLQVLSSMLSFALMTVVLSLSLLLVAPSPTWVQPLYLVAGISFGFGLVSFFLLQKIRKAMARDGQRKALSVSREFSPLNQGFEIVKTYMSQQSEKSQADKKFERMEESLELVIEALQEISESNQKENNKSQSQEGAPHTNFSRVQ